MSGGEFTHNLQDLETKIEPSSIGVATATLYRQWVPTTETANNSVDKIRGDLALQTISAAQKLGYQIAVVDGGSSAAFVDALVALGVTPQPEQDRSMSGSRRQVFQEVSQLVGVEVIAWIEPEKVSMVRDCLPAAVVPLLQNLTDIVIPQRQQSSWASYPDFQVVYEQRANSLWNEMLRAHRLLSASEGNLDAWFGPRFFRNDPQILALFLTKYVYQQQPESKLDLIVNPELWPNALFLPIVAALHQGWRVQSKSVPYLHPFAQTALEQDNQVFRRKREVQRKNIMVATMHYLRLLAGKPRNKLRQAVLPGALY